MAIDVKLPTLNHQALWDVQDGFAGKIQAFVEPAAFLIDVRARPLSLLRAVTGFAGDTANTYLEHEITTPSLMLPSAGELARKCNAHISTP